MIEDGLLKFTITFARYNISFLSEELTPISLRFTLKSG